YHLHSSFSYTLCLGCVSFVFLLLLIFFFFNDIATTEIYTLSLHDALPISWFRVCHCRLCALFRLAFASDTCVVTLNLAGKGNSRSEEHTSELQSRFDLVCRLLLEKKNIIRHD